MSEEFGSYLQQLRLGRKLTTAQLARKAGIRRATLSEWQSNKRRPRLPELEAVLDALGASVTQKQEVRERLQTPGELLRLRQITQQSNPDLMELAGHIPHGGDLLRAMRMRKRWKQTQLAQALDVSQSTLVRWERTEQWPDTAQLHRLCYLLEAREEELFALTMGRISLAGGEAQLTADQIQERLLHIIETRGLEAEYALAELRLLSLLAHAWSLTTRSEAGHYALAKLNVWYAEHLYLSRRFQEARDRASRALDFYAHSRLQDIDTHLATIRLAEASAQTDSRQGLDHAIQILEGLRSQTSDVKNFVTLSGWIQSDLARFTARRGQTEQAIELGREAVQVALNALSPDEEEFRRHDLAKVLLQANRPHEAQELLGGTKLYPHPYFQIIKARTHLALEEHAEASSLLQEVSNWLDTHYQVTEPQIPYYRHEVEALMEHLPPSAMPMQ